MCYHYFLDVVFTCVAACIHFIFVYTLSLQLGFSPSPPRFLGPIPPISQDGKWYKQPNYRITHTEGWISYSNENYCEIWKDVIKNLNSKFCDKHIFLYSFNRNLLVSADSIVSPSHIKTGYNIEHMFMFAISWLIFLPVHFFFLYLIVQNILYFNVQCLIYANYTVTYFSYIAFQYARYNLFTLKVWLG